MSKNKQSERVLNLPAGYFGMVLGIIGMGFAWRYASQVWPVSHLIGDGLVILAMVIWGLLTLAFLSRLLRFPHSVLAEIRHPVMSSFVSLFPATTMLVAIGFVPWYRPLAIGLFSIGVVIQLAYAAWQTAGVWGGSRPEARRRVCICRPSPITLSVQWPVAHWVSTTQDWCFWAPGFFPGSVWSR